MTVKLNMDAAKATIKKSLVAYTDKLWEVNQTVCLTM